MFKLTREGQQKREKKFLTSAGESDRIAELSQTRGQRTLITEQ